jgi:TfoX/Sxy family transcriptional regulator of competence genes
MRQTATSAKKTSGGPRRKPAAPAPATVEDTKFAPVVEAFDGDKRVEQGRMFGSVSLKVNGKVFAMLVKGRLVVKLPRERVDALITSGSGDYFDPGHGKLMKEWAAVSSASRSWVPLAKEAYSFVKGDAR